MTHTHNSLFSFPRTSSPIRALLPIYPCTTFIHPSSSNNITARISLQITTSRMSIFPQPLLGPITTTSPTALYLDPLRAIKIYSLTYTHTHTHTHTAATRRYNRDSRPHYALAILSPASDESLEPARIYIHTHTRAGCNLSASGRSQLWRTEIDGTDKSRVDAESSGRPTDLRIQCIVYNICSAYTKPRVSAFLIYMYVYIYIYIYTHTNGD